jgi:hypothetical protein
MAARYWVGGTDTWDATAGTKWALTTGGAGGQAVPTSSDTVFFDAASGASTVTIGASTAICSTLTMTGFTGTLAFGTNSITLTGIGNTNIFAGGATYSVTGTPLILCTGNGVAGQTRSISGMALVTEANAISFTFSAGADAINTGTTLVFKDLIFTSGFTGNLNGQDRVIFGNLTLSSGMTSSVTTGSTVLGSTNGSQQVTTNGSLVNFNLNFGRSLATTAATGNGTTATLTFAAQTNPPFNVGSTINVVGLVPAGYNGTYTVTACTTTTVSYASATTGSQTTAGGVGTTNTVQLQDALTLGTARTLTHASGTFDLNDKTVTTGLFSHGSASVRTMAFGTTGSVNLTGNNTNIWITNSASVTTLTGTKTVNLTYSGATGTRAVLTGSNAYINNRFNFNVTAGSDTVNFQNLVNNLDFTGFSGAWQNQILTINGNLTVSSGMSITAGANGITLYNWGGTQQVTSAGKNFNFPVATGLGANVTGASGTGTTATLTFSALNAFPPVGSTVVITGMNPAGYNGTYTVTASSTTSVSYANTTTGSALANGVVWTSSTIRLVDDLSVGTSTSRTVTFSAATLDLNDKTLTNFGSFSSSTTSPRSIAFGATGNYTNKYNLGTATIFNVATATNFSITGTPTINISGNATTGTRRLDYGNTALPASPEANSLSFYITAGSDAVQITSTAPTRNLDFTGSFTGSLVNSSRSIYGNYTLNSSMIVQGSNLTTTFASTSGTQLITTAGQTLDIPITINAVGAGVQLVDNLTIGVTRTFTLTAGTVDLNNKTLSTGVFFTNTTLVREIIFGNDSVNGIIRITGYSTAGNTLLVFRADGVTNLTLTGYPQVVLDSTLGDPTGIRSIAGGLSATEARRFFINVINGTDIVSVGGTRDYRTIDFTGFGGTLQTTGSNLTNLAGGLIFSSAMTVGTLAFGFTFSSGYGASFTASQSGFNLTVSSVTGVLGAGCTVSDASNNNIGKILSQTSGTTGGAGVYVLDTSATIASQAMTSFWKVDTQNKSIGASIQFGSNIVGVFKLQSALTLTGTLNLSGGTFNSNSQDVTTGTFSGNNSTTKTLNISNSTFTVNGGSSSSGFQIVSSGTTYNLTGCNIVFTTAGVTNFYASGGTPTTVTMAGTGTLLLGGSAQTATITTLQNTVQPCTISLIFDMTRLIVTNFNLSGTAGNLVTLNSSVAGTAVNIRKTSGTVNAQYLYIQDSVADGGAEWRASNSVNAGNNTGWLFDYALDVFEDFSAADTIEALKTFNTDAVEPIIFEDTASSLAAFAAAIVEAADLFDAQIVIYLANSAITEALTLADTPTATAIFASVVLENVNLADSQTVVASFAVVASEGSVLNDAQSVLASFVSSLSEAITAEDSSLAVKIHNSNITEDFTALDAQTALRIHNALIAENIDPADAATVIASFSSKIVENLVLLDAPFPRGWYAINDGQVGAWNTVDNLAAGTWVDINDGQTVIWTKVNNNYP